MSQTPNTISEAGQEPYFLGFDNSQNMMFKGVSSTLALSDENELNNVNGVRSVRACTHVCNKCEHVLRHEESGKVITFEYMPMSKRTNNQGQIFYPNKDTELFTICTLGSHFPNPVVELIDMRDPEFNKMSIHTAPMSNCPKGIPSENT